MASGDPHPQPQAGADGAGLDDKMFVGPDDVQQLEHTIGVLSNELALLERSVAELRRCLEEEPEDREYKLAVSENITIIARKRSQLASLRASLELLREQGHAGARSRLAAAAPAAAGQRADDAAGGDAERNAAAPASSSEGSLLL